MSSRFIVWLWVVLVEQVVRVQLIDFRHSRCRRWEVNRAQTECKAKC
jgi:hypothetical protein